MKTSKSRFVAGLFLPLNSISTLVKTVVKSTNSLKESYEDAKANLDNIRAVNVKKMATRSEEFGEKFEAAVSRYNLDLIAVKKIQTYMRNRKRIGIVLFYVSLFSLFACCITFKPLGAAWATLALLSAWAFALRHAIREQQLRERKLFSFKYYRKVHGLTHPLIWS